MEDKIYRGIRLLAGEITPQEYSIYDFQKGGAFDVTVPAMKGKEGGTR
jgi:conjugal transfer pilus assembly protein TraF